MDMSMAENSAVLMADYLAASKAAWRAVLTVEMLAVSMAVSMAAS